MTQANLFDPPVRGHRPTRSDAVKNREAGMVEGSRRKARLYEALLDAYALRGWTDAELAFLLNVERTTINARRNELMAMGKVQELEGQSRKNPKTGISNTVYALVSQAKVQSEK